MANIREIFSRDPYYGGIGKAEEAVLSYLQGEETRQLVTLIELMESNASKDITMGLTAAGLSIFAHTPQATNEILERIYSVAVVTPDTPRYSKLEIGKPTDTTQINDIRYRGTVESVRAFRKIFEQHGGDPHVIFDILRGDAFHEISRLGKKELLDMLAKSGIVSGVVMLGGMITASEAPQVGSTFAAVGALNAIASGINHWHATKVLNEQKAAAMPYLIKQYPNMMPLITSVYDLHSRKVLQENFPSQSSQEARKAANTIYQLPADIEEHPLIMGNKTFTQLPLHQRQSFMERMLIDDKGDLKPLWQVLMMGRSLEIQSNLNRRDKGIDVPNALPLIGPDQAHMIPTLVKEIGSTRLAAMKKANALIAEPKTERRSTRNSEHTDLQDSIAKAKSEIMGTANKKTPYVTLSLAFPMTQNLTHISAIDPKRHNPDDTKNHADYIYLKEAERNYGGNGIADAMIAEYWKTEPTFPFGSPFFMEHYKNRLMTPPGPKRLPPIKEIPTSTWEGINGNNAWGKLLTTLLTAAHHDPTDTEVGDGYVNIVNHAIDTLAKQSRTNPAALYELQIALVAQTDALVHGRLWLNNLRETHPNWRVVNGHDPQAERSEKQKFHETDKGLHMLETSLNNIATVRSHTVSSLMHYMLEDAALVLRAKKIDEAQMPYIDQDRYFETDYPYSSLYATLVTLTREAPDMAEEITEPLRKILINSGIYTTAAQLSYEFLYTLGFLKSYTKDASIPDEKRKIFLDAYEEIIRALGSHSFSNFNRVERGDFGREYIRVSANYYKDCINLMDDESCIASIHEENGLSQKLESIIETHTIESMDWRQTVKKTSRHEFIDIILATSEDIIREITGRISQSTDAKIVERLESTKTTLQARISTINKTIERTRAEQLKIHRTDVHDYS